MVERVYIFIIYYKTKLHGVGFGYQIETYHGEALFLVEYLDGRFEFFFYDSQKKLVSILFENNEARMLSQLINLDKLP